APRLGRVQSGSSPRTMRTLRTHSGSATGPAGGGDGGRRTRGWDKPVEPLPKNATSAAATAARTLVERDTQFVVANPEDVAVLDDLALHPLAIELDAVGRAQIHH